MSEKKILFISSINPEEGAPHHFMAAFYLSHKGHSLRSVCVGPASRALINFPLGQIMVTSIPERRGIAGRLLWHVSLVFKLVKMQLTSNKCLFYIQGSVVTPAIFLVLFAVGRNRLVYHTQDYLEPGRHPFWAYFEKRVARRAGHVICNEPNRARFMASSYQLKAMPTIVRTALPRDWPVPERDEKLRQSLLQRVNRSGDGQRLVMVQGFLGKLRGGPQIIEALASLPDNFILVTTSAQADSQEYKIYHEQAGQSGILERIIFLPTLEFTELLQYTAACDIGMMLYPNDGVGNFYQAPGKLTEFMRCGLHIVTSNFPGLELLTLKYGIGIACDPESSTDIAAAILKLGSRSDHELAQERARLKTLATTEFAYESQAWQIEEIVNKVKCEI